MRLSIAGSLRLALTVLTVVLATVAAAAVVDLYNSRQGYERTLVRTSELATAVANLSTAGIAEAAILRDRPAPRLGPARRGALRAFNRAAQTATEFARADPTSARLLATQIALQAHIRQLAGAGRLHGTTAPGPLAETAALAAEVQTRQQALERAAQIRAQRDSRSAVTLVVIAGGLALISALVLVSALIRSMRGPLDELVTATRELAAGGRARRVRPAGPSELKALGHAFNAMGADLIAARSQIEAERRRLAVTIESLGDGLLVTGEDGVTIRTVNPRAADLVPELAPGSRTDGERSPLPALEVALEREIVVETDGRILAVTAGRLGAAGVGGVVWTVRDVAERTRLERAKSEFVATASHELRSPLTSIKGFAELLHRSGEHMTPRQNEFVDIILRSTDRLVELVSDLLDVARIEADSVEISRRPIDIGEAVREVAELMGPRIEAKRQRLGVYVSPALPLALADPARIRQIIANLLTNAHLYTEAGGRIHMGVEADRARVRIVIADSGIGMTESERKRAFERFFRARAGDESVPGTGLGLSIVKSLVDLHEGEIELESEPGRGTTFHVLIPAAVVPVGDGPSLEVIRGRRILIVDDEPEIAALVADQLAALDIRATIATDGASALAHLRSEHYDAITLDIVMPGMDGFEVLRQIRADNELRAIPILFVSVFAGRRELAGEWTVGKPIDADELRDVLAAAVRAGRSRVLVIAREDLQVRLEPALDELGIEHQWETTVAAAARVCGERRFEVALIDVGIRNPRAALQALQLRGRRLRRAMILFSDDHTPTPPGISDLGMEVVPVQDAAQALLGALRGETDHVRQGVSAAIRRD
jgi:signal transduction histidine kinase